MSLPRFSLVTRSAFLLAASCFAPGLQAEVLWDNGPLITHVGGMINGADRSAISPGASTIGAGAQQSAGNRVAEDFTVSVASWTVDSARFFSYQTGSTTTSTLTGITLRIWNDVPGVGSVVWGDDTTNVMSGTGFTGIYRTTSTDNTVLTRPLMFVDVDLAGLELPAGTYWLDFAFTGTLASGPWAPPLGDATEFVTGNARQLVSTGDGNFNPLIDGGSGPNLALPFILEGTAAAIPEPASFPAMLGVGAIAIAALRRRR